MAPRTVQEIRAATAANLDAWRVWCLKCGAETDLSQVKNAKMDPCSCGAMAWSSHPPGAVPGCSVQYGPEIR